MAGMPAKQRAWLLVNISGDAAGEGISSNPLKQVLDAVEERVDCAVYDKVRPNVNTVLFTHSRVVDSLLGIKAAQDGAKRACCPGIATSTRLFQSVTACPSV